MNTLMEKPKADDSINEIINRGKRDVNKHSKDFIKYKQGWVLPDGKFYPCLVSMEHIWLANKLGKTEKEAENAGWMKISYSVIGIYVICMKKPTQKQLNTLFDWVEVSESRREAYNLFMEYMRTE